MLYAAKNGTIDFPGTAMDYIRFGSGKKTLVMLPGLGDGLRSVKGMALPMAVLYRVYAKEYTVYLFSRKQKLWEGIPPGLWPGTSSWPWRLWALPKRTCSACPWAA